VVRGPVLRSCERGWRESLGQEFLHRSDLRGLSFNDLLSEIAHVWVRRGLEHLVCHHDGALVVRDHHLQPHLIKGRAC